MSSLPNAAGPRVLIVQPALPAYRKDLFGRLARHFGSRFSVFTSRQDDLGILEGAGSLPDYAVGIGAVRRLFRGVDWQVGTLSIPLQRGDLLVLGGSARALTTPLLIMKARLKGAHVMWWGQYRSSTSTPFGAGLRHIMMARADAIVFYTEREIADYKAAGRHSNAAQLAGLNNGIDNSNIRRLRVAYKAETRLRDMLFIGRVTDKADLPLLLRTMALPSCAALTLDVVGEGRQLAFVRTLAQDLGVVDRVVWHGGILDEQRIADIANTCKVFVYPGSVGLSLIHGLAYGLPAILHDDRWTQMPEIAAHEPEVNGRVFIRGDAASLARTLVGMLAEPDTLLRMSHQAIATTENSFNTEDMARRFIAAIETVLGDVHA